MSSKYLFSVCHGPDSRHLIECKVFYLKRNAIKFIESLGPNRAFKFERLYFPNKMSVCTENKFIMERVI